MSIVQPNKMKEIELLYKKFYKALYLYAITFLGSEEEAKDVVSDVFQMIWEGMKKGKTQQKEITSSFLYTIVRNRCIDLLRHTQATQKYAYMEKASAEISTDEDVMEFESRINHVYNIIGELPEPGQSVLRCTYFDGLSYKETATKLQISENMVHKHMVRMFKLLRNMLKKQ